MSKIGYLAAYYMPLFCSSRHVTVIATISCLALIYTLFFLSSNFLQSSYAEKDNTSKKTGLFVPNEQDYFRTCLLGVFSPLLFNFVRTFLFKAPTKNPVLIVLSNIFVDYYVYDWFLFLIIYFLAYPQLDTSEINNSSSAKPNFTDKDYVRNVFHIIPKQSYILAICWSLSECMLSILEKLSVYQELVSPKKAAYEEMGLSKPHDLNILRYCFKRVQNRIHNFFSNSYLKIKRLSGFIRRFFKSGTLKTAQEDELLPVKVDLSRCANVMQKSNMQQRYVQYEISDSVSSANQISPTHDNNLDLVFSRSNSSFLNDENSELTDSADARNDTISTKKLEDVVFINFKDQTMHVEKFPQEQLTYGSLPLLHAIKSNSRNAHKGISNFSSSNHFSNKNVSFTDEYQNKYDPKIEILRMRGKPRPGHLFTNKSFWQVKKETELLKLEILEQQRKEDMSKYKQKLLLFQQQRQLLETGNNKDIMATSAGLQAINSGQSNSLQQVEKNLDEELNKIKQFYQNQQSTIKETIELCNVEIRNHQKVLRDRKIKLQPANDEPNSHNLESYSNKQTNLLRSEASSERDHDTARSSFNSDAISTGGMNSVTYNFYRIDSVELFLQELRNTIIIFTSSILCLIGEALLFSVYLIYVPGKEELFTPTVNYFGDKPFTTFAMLVIFPFTFINFTVHLIVLFWPTLRQEYLLLNMIGDFELLWGVDDDILNQLNSDRHLQNLDSNIVDEIAHKDLTNNECDLLLSRNQGTKNPIKWLKGLFRKNRNDIKAYGHAETDIYNHFSGYNGFQKDFNNQQSRNSGNAGFKSSNAGSDYYQNVIDRIQLNADIDPLEQTGGIQSLSLKQFGTMHGEEESSRRGFDNNRRNMSIISANDIRLLDKASLISSNLTLKEIVLVLMYRLKKLVILWRLNSESWVFVLSVLLGFGLVCFALGVLASTTDVFLYFDHY